MKPKDANNAEDLIEKEDDVEFFGNQKLWKVLTKAYSDEDEWNDTTLAMEVPGGVVLRSTYYDGMNEVCSMSMVFIPGCKLKENDNGTIEII